MRVDEINKRLADIEAELRAEDADIDALNAEVDALIEERSSLTEQAEKRAATLEKLANRQAGVVVADLAGKEVREMEFDCKKEYRSAWVKNLMGVDMTENEQRAFTQANVKTIPTELSDEIISKIKGRNPIFNKITLLNVKGNVKFAVEGTTKDAALHAENAAITADADTMVEVSLTAYEITKLVQISASASTMSIAAFETWLTDNIADRLAAKAVSLMIAGTGTSQPKGLNTETWTADINAIEVEKAAELTAANVLALVGLLPSAYDSKACFLMSKKTLFTDFMPLQDKSKNDLVQNVNGTFYVLGYEVVLCDEVAIHEAFLGDFSKVVGNLAMGEEVIKAFDITTNSYKYLGAAAFDSKLALAEAMVKLVKKSA